MSTTVRTRFAPSPTGFMHVGGVRTALFAWLLARKRGGKFILRIEDTDQDREVTGSVQHIIKSLGWLGIDWDEGPDRDGQYGPYKQSERLDIYKKWAVKLVEQDKAYPDPYDKNELQAFRDQARAEKRPFLFRDYRPGNPPVWDGTQPLRLRSEPKEYQWQDAVMGDLATGPEVIDDFILMKSDGFPTYNFAHIIDDHEMQITHVIRSQEFIASIPKYLNLYEALEISPPIMATLPFVLNPGGNKKLSKRDGAKDILDYQKEGYLPEAMVNFLATLGWNDGTEQEIFTTEELIKKFDPARVHKGGAQFDEQRLIWLNGAHIRNLSSEDLYIKVEKFWSQAAKNYTDDYKKQVLSLVQERLKFFAELPELTQFFFEDLPVNPDLIANNKQLKKLDLQEQKELLMSARAKLIDTTFDVESLQEALNKLLDETGQKPGILFSLIRIATTQSSASPGLAETLAVLRKETVMRRINEQLEHL